jgi:hypothetical protein
MEDVSTTGLYPDTVEEEKVNPTELKLRNFFISFYSHLIVTKI